ncbi:MAG: DUF4830 domain-containing protein [Oscillospiraceae bacterium]|nr:DUF4830 domain-containing protein [Oscillospiraceae bacterium]
MFVITLNRKKINQAVAVFICVVTATAVGLGVKNYFTKDSAAAASVKTKLSTTQEMVDYIASKGFSADIQTAQVTEVEIPRKFDDNFVGFNEKIKQNDGLSLERYKGDKVSKWTFDIIDYPNGDVDAAAVLLIRRERLIGAYILEKPDGIAKAMVVTSQQ